MKALKRLGIGFCAALVCLLSAGGVYAAPAKTQVQKHMLKDAVRELPQCHSWKDLEAAFYRDRSTFPLDALVMPESVQYYEEGSGFTEKPLPGLETARFFPVYTLHATEEDGSDWDSITGVFANNTDALLSDYLFEDTEQFGIIIPPKDDFPGFEGMAYASEENGKTVYNCRYGTAIFENEPLWLEISKCLRMDENLIAALEAAGMRPETTRAVYIECDWSPGVCMGLLFFDGKRELFCSTAYGVDSQEGPTISLTPIDESPAGWFKCMYQPEAIYRGAEEAA